MLQFLVSKIVICYVGHLYDSNLNCMCFKPIHDFFNYDKKMLASHQLYYYIIT